MNTLDITEHTHGKTPSGENVSLFTLTNGTVTVKVSTYGGAITEIWAPDKNGAKSDIVLGFDSLAGYFGKNPYFGCLVGRYANRIAKGKFALDGKTFSLATNDGANHLHGGERGFDKVVWNAKPEKGTDSVSLNLSYASPDGEEGYPGTLQANVVYSLNMKNELHVRYEATTEKPTTVNLTQHSYFNLSGDGSRDILGHTLTINARHFTAVDESLIPTGVIQSVEGGPMDFQSPTAIGARIADVSGGYDHNYVLNRKGEGLETAAILEDSASGRKLDILTTEPGLQFYSGNFLDGTITGKSGRMYDKHFGLCLETQHYPDSPNRPEFPSTILRPGESYRHHTVFRFSTR